MIYKILAKNLMMTFFGLFSIAFLLIWLGICNFLSEEDFFSPVTLASAKESVYLYLDFGGLKKERNFSTLVLRNERVKIWNLLQQATAFAGMDLQAEDGYVPVRIDGVPSKSGKNAGIWQLYVNYEKHELKPFEATVGAGDKVIFKFEQIGKRN